MFGLGKKEKVKKLKFKILSSVMSEDYQKKLLKEQSSSDLKGYRKGKAPLDVIENIYGEQLKARVIYEVMTNEFYKIITDKKISVVGQPALNPLSMDIKKDIIEHLWKVIISDNSVDQYEANLMRRVCGLIYFPDKECAEIKLKLLSSK